MTVILIVCTLFVLWILISLVIEIKDKIKNKINNLKLEKMEVRKKLELELFKSLSKNEKVKYLKNNPSSEIKFHVKKYLKEDEEVERKLVKETYTSSSYSSYSNKTYFIFDEYQNLVYDYTTTELHYRINSGPGRKNHTPETTRVVFIDKDYIEN